MKKSLVLYIEYMLVNKHFDKEQDLHVKLINILCTVKQLLSKIFTLFFRLNSDHYFRLDLFLFYFSTSLIYHNESNQRDFLKLQNNQFKFDNVKQSNIRRTNKTSNVYWCNSCICFHFFGSCW